VVEVQIKARTDQDNAIGASVLRDDCCKKYTLSPEPNEFTLHILSAQKMTKVLQDKTVGGILVLKPGERVTFKPGRANATDVEVTVPERMYLVVLSPLMNQQWLSSALDPSWLVDEHTP